MNPAQPGTEQSPERAASNAPAGPLPVVKRDVVVIGAGIIGACCAAALVREGHRVTVVDPSPPGGRHSASFGNGAWFSPASVVPMSTPGLWRRIPGLVLDRKGPLTITPGALFSGLPWLLRFMAAGSTLTRVSAIAQALAPLLRHTASAHQSLARWAEVDTLVAKQGLLYAYTDEASLRADALAWQLRRDNQVDFQPLEGAAFRERAPGIAKRYQLGMWVAEGAHCLDPGAYVSGLIKATLAAGAQWVPAHALGFLRDGPALRAVRTDRGDLVCDRAVIAAGIHSTRLAAQLGDSVPLISERGYHVQVGPLQESLPQPVMPSDGKMGNTPTLGGFRAAGQVELASPDAPPDWRRADLLLDHLRDTWPELARRPATEVNSRWMGHRPSTPDGLPVIEAAPRCPAVLYAFGHGHVGMAAAPATASIIADLVAGRASAFNTDPYRASRFR